MHESIRVNLYKEVCAITSVLMDPYRSFIRRLHADGRVTKAETTKLNQHNGHHEMWRIWRAGVSNVATIAAFIRPTSAIPIWPHPSLTEFTDY